MAPSPKLASPAKRRWSARAWWVGLHVYVYAVLAYNGSLSPSALTAGWFAFAIALAVVNLISYIILQTSSPGFVEPSQRDLEAGGQRVIVDHDAVVSIDECDHASDSEALVRSKSADASDSGLHFCELCQLTQPLRTKHWYDLRTSTVCVCVCLCLCCLVVAPAYLLLCVLLQFQQGLREVRASI